jgi:integrase
MLRRISPEEKRPIYEVSSSHMARRTFIGNLYKRVKDPNLVGSLSGHTEGSRAFTRYREIDDDIKKEIVDMLE